ncbi:hypothetical protein BDQ17DRAFT_760734 [Cyathus striatus]|nr:hypothetical protein BDQ17DRAFT_760734 [Cyathus striatus]
MHCWGFVLLVFFSASFPRLYCLMLLHKSLDVYHLCGSLGFLSITVLLFLLSTPLLSHVSSTPLPLHRLLLSTSLPICSLHFAPDFSFLWLCTFFLGLISPSHFNCGERGTD